MVLLGCGNESFGSAGPSLTSPNKQRMHTDAVAGIADLGIEDRLQQLIEVEFLLSL